MKRNYILLTILICEVWIKVMLFTPDPTVFIAANVAKVSETPMAVHHVKPKPVKLASRSDDNRNIMLLAGVVCRESHNQPKTGKVAVGTVVLNRLANGHYGKTLERIIFSPHQFAYTDSPCQECINVAKNVWGGKRAFGKQILYFWNPRTSNDYKFINSVTVVYRIGDHVFGKK